MSEELWSFTMTDVDDILSHTAQICPDNNYFNDHILASLDTSVSPVDFLTNLPSSTNTNHGIDEYFWADSSSPESSPSSTDSDYSLCSSPIKYEDQVKPITDMKPISGINKRTRKPKETQPKTNKESTFDGNSSLFFTRSELLKMTVDELENRVAAVEAVRRLTDKEKKEIKKQRRMIKNRESAMASRIRKKQLVENMEEAMSKIQLENDSLKKRVAELEKENEQLKARVNEPFWSIGGSSTFNPAKIATQTSTSLFIILLSFGLLFAQIQPQDNNSFPHFSSVFPSYEAQQILGSGHVITYAPGQSKAAFGTTSSLGIQNRALLMHGDSLDDSGLTKMEIESRAMLSARGVQASSFEFSHPTSINSSNTTKTLFHSCLAQTLPTVGSSNSRQDDNFLSCDYS